MFFTSLNGPWSQGVQTSEGLLYQESPFSVVTSPCTRLCTVNVTHA